ncbi:MAG: hypothetical protein V3T81_08025 [Thermoanaerobaculia bacterium]
MAEGANVFAVTKKSGGIAEVRADRVSTSKEGLLRFYVGQAESSEVVAEFAPGEWKDWFKKES